MRSSPGDEAKIQSAPVAEQPIPIHQNQSIESRLNASRSKQHIERQSDLSKSALEPTTERLNYDDVEREYLRSKPTKNTEKLGVNQEPVLNRIESSTNDIQDTHVEGRINDVSARWNPDLAIKDQFGLFVDEVPPKSNFSWFRLMILVVPGAFIIFFIRAFVVSEAQTVFPDPQNNGAEVNSEALREGNAPIPTNTQSDSLYAL